MDNQVELRHTNVTGGWLQALPAQPSRAQACEVLANPSSAQLAALWNGLISGSTRVVSEHSDRTHHYLELTSALAEPAPPHHLARWLPILMGTSAKVVAANGGWAGSTVASSAAHCLRCLGLDCSSRGVPMVLVMMAHASARLATDGFFGAERLHSSTMIRVRRPDLALASLLSPGELAVLQLLVDGLSHREIAAARSTATRTIANQLASAYTKLGVSGRSELLAGLVKHDAGETFSGKPRESVAPGVSRRVERSLIAPNFETPRDESRLASTACAG